MSNNLIIIKIKGKSSVQNIHIYISRAPICVFVLSVLCLSVFLFLRSGKETADQ